MIVRRFAAGGLLCAAALFAATPAAVAATPSGSSAPGPSTFSSSINLGCILDTLSGGGKTADCSPPTVPVR